jgi:hypothetical protein
MNDYWDDGGGLTLLAPVYTTQDSALDVFAMMEMGGDPNAIAVQTGDARVGVGADGSSGTSTQPTLYGPAGYGFVPSDTSAPTAAGGAVDYSSVADIFKGTASAIGALSGVLRSGVESYSILTGRLTPQQQLAQQQADRDRALQLQDRSLGQSTLLKFGLIAAGVAAVLIMVKRGGA